MPRVRLKGLNCVRKRLSDGSQAVYWYAWKGGPRLPGRPGTPEFMAAYYAAVSARRQTGRDTLRGLAVRYKESPEWAKLGASTKAEWVRWLDRLMSDEKPKDLGSLPFEALNDRRVRADILAWRDQWADRPRSADYGMQVLSRVLGWGVSRGLLALNVAAGVEQLYKSDRADQIWSTAEIEAFEAHAKSPEVAFIIRLACLTGLRREDLVTLTWDQVGDLAIVKPTGKSRGRRTVVIPLLDETKTLLQRIQAQQAERRRELAAVADRKQRPLPPVARAVLTNTRGLPWTVNGLEHQVIAVKSKAGIDKHLHDARGSFATRLRRAGLTASEIADVLGWEEARVERLLATYVDRDAVVLALAERIRQNETRTKTPN